MSRLGDLRTALKAFLVSEELFVEDAVIIKRSLDFWNNIAVATSASKHGVVCSIDIPAGDNPDADGPLSATLVIPITILCPASMSIDDEPVEDLWEAMVKKVHGLVLPPQRHCMYEFKFQSFSDEVELGDQAEAYNARQTVFKVLQPF